MSSGVLSLPSLPGAPANGASPIPRQPTTIKLTSLSYPPGPRRRLRCRSLSFTHSFTPSHSFVATSPSLPHYITFFSPWSQCASTVCFPAGSLQYIPWPSIYHEETYRRIPSHPHPAAFSVTCTTTTLPLLPYSRLTRIFCLETSAGRTPGLRRQLRLPAALVSRIQT
jgi:hypothetical protein